MHNVKSFSISKGNYSLTCDCDNNIWLLKDDFFIIKTFPKQDTNEAYNIVNLTKLSAFIDNVSYLFEMNEYERGDCMYEFMLYLDDKRYREFTLYSGFRNFLNKYNFKIVDR